MISKSYHKGLRQVVMALTNWAEKCFGKTLNWHKLPNSGETLKLRIPNYSLKAISGWSNDSCKVKSPKMKETEMGYRGSKSELVSQTETVKEQRVDGSYCITNNIQLRCTLMGFEKNYPVKFLTKQLNNRNYSTIVCQSKFNPWFITGFSDAEASFIVSIYKTDNLKLKWRVTPNFSIHIHIKDIELLKSIRDTFGVGKVRQNSISTAVFRVDNLQDLQVIVNHFDKYSLIGAKVSDFILFKKCYDLIKQKQHLTQEGLEKILALKCNLNKGLSDELKEAFPNIIPVPRPFYKFKGIPDPFWISGFVSGDSTFSVSLEKFNNKIGYRVRLIFGTCLHVRDKELLIGISNYFYKNILIGKYIYESEKRECILLQIKNYSDIVHKIIPFFNKYPILGVKSLDFADFKKVSELMETKEHLTESGFSKIVKIVKKMNLDRNNFQSSVT